MIPLRDVIPSRTTPFVTVALILLNAGVFLYGHFMGTEEALMRTYALVPAEFSWLTVFTSMFLHAGWLHVGSNLLVLWIFGDNVEDRMGHLRYLVFYLLTGAAATYAEMWHQPSSVIPLVGASGAIAGVMGAYVVLFPQSRVLMLMFFPFLDVVEVPAIAFLMGWFVLQVAGGVAAVQDTGGIAYFAHLGGFAAGLTLVWVFRRREREDVEWWTTTNN